MMWAFVFIAIAVLAYLTYQQVIELRRQVASLTTLQDQQTDMLLALLQKQGIDRGSSTKTASRPDVAPPVTRGVGLNAMD